MIFIQARSGLNLGGFASSRAPMQKNSKILLAVALLLISLTAVILYNSATVFLQLFIAFAMAYILNPAVVYLESHRVNRVASILIVFTTALVACIGFGAFLAISISGLATATGGDQGIRIFTLISIWSPRLRQRRCAIIPSAADFWGQSASA